MKWNMKSNATQNCAFMFDTQKIFLTCANKWLFLGHETWTAQEYKIKKQEKKVISQDLLGSVAVGSMVKKFHSKYESWNDFAVIFLGSISRPL